MERGEIVLSTSRQKMSLSITVIAATNMAAATIWLITFLVCGCAPGHQNLCLKPQFVAAARNFDRHVMFQEACFRGPCHVLVTFWDVTEM